MNTTASGRIRNSTRKASATASSAMRVIGDSVSGSDTRAVASRRSTYFSVRAARSATLSPPRPRLQQVDREQQNKRGNQHRACQYGCAAIIELFELDDDEQRQDFRDSRHVA